MKVRATTIPNAVKHPSKNIAHLNTSQITSVIFTHLNKFIDVVPCFLDVSNAPFDITPCKIFDSVTT